MKPKEKNFVSAIIYLRNGEKDLLSFLDALGGQLEEHFDKFEIIVAKASCRDGNIGLLRDWAAKKSHPLTILHMSLEQSRENCMNAGIDASIGDFVFEFDSLRMPYDPGLIFKAYERALEGHDIVSVCPEKQQGLSALFYGIFNRNSHSAYPIRTEAFRVVSRRAINRVHAMSDYMPYRKAAYAASGLRCSMLSFPGALRETQESRFRLAVESLLLYTNAGYRFSVGLTLAMMLVALAATAYAICIFATGRPIEGWTTIMLVLTLGMAGLFGVLSIIIKYLALLLNLVFCRQPYLIENIEKIQK